MTIHVVGLGIDPGNLPEDSQWVVDNAEVIFGGRRQLEQFADHPAEKHQIRAPISETLDMLAEISTEENVVAVLADGDPLFYGIGVRIVERFGADGVRIYPGVTALQAAAARLKIPWQEVAAVSLHGRDDLGPLFSALTRSDWVAVFTDDRNIPSSIAQAVLDKGGDTHAAWVLENMGTENERIRRLTLAEAAETHFSGLNVVLLERVEPPEVRLGMGTPDEEFAECGAPVTKGPVRAVSLASLRMTPDDVLWDLGAGCGALGIEASIICRKGRVYAVEKNADRVSVIRENVRRSGAYLVEVVHGAMPRCLADLPDPDRVFIGGGMGRDGKLLAAACSRLNPGGRLVANIVLLENLLKAKQVFESMGWTYFLTLVHASESSKLAWDIHMEAVNPVFVIGADKPAEE